MDEKEPRKRKPPSPILKNTAPVTYSLWGEEDIQAESLKVIKRREAKRRASADVHTDRSSLTNFPSIILPFRWESLQREARKRNVLIQPFIKPVQDAIASVSKELRQHLLAHLGRKAEKLRALGWGKQFACGHAL